MASLGLSFKNKIKMNLLTPIRYLQPERPFLEETLRSFYVTPMITPKIDL